MVVNKENGEAGWPSRFVFSRSKFQFGGEVKKMNETFDQQYVAFAGSRTLGASSKFGSPYETARSVLADVLSTPRPEGVGALRIVTGCATGADEMVIKAGLELGLPLRIYTIMNSSFRGGWKSTAVQVLKDANSCGAEIVWEAGGSIQDDLVRRLKSRTLKMLNDVQQAGSGSGVLAFWSNSRGTALTIKEAISRGLPVVALPIEATSDSLPKVGKGNWVPRSGSMVKSSSFRWMGPS